MFTFEIWTKETFQLHVICKIILHSYVYHIKKTLHTVLLYLGRNIYFETRLVRATNDSQVMYNDSSISSYCFLLPNPLGLHNICYPGNVPNQVK